MRVKQSLELGRSTVCGLWEILVSSLSSICNLQYTYMIIYIYIDNYLTVDFPAMCDY